MQIQIQIQADRCPNMTSPKQKTHSQQRAWKRPKYFIYANTNNKNTNMSRPNQTRTSLAGVGFCPNTELQIFSPPAVADHLPFQDLQETAFQDLQETAFREEVASLLRLPTTAFILIHIFLCGIANIV